jgi:thiol-disulfide isomerase/thioredoxin
MRKTLDAVALAVAILLGFGALYMGWSWKTSPAATESRAPDEAPKPTISPGVLYATTFLDLSGKQRALGEWQGKVVVLNFWATWCAPCLEEIPLFVKLQSKYADKGLVFVGLAIDEGEKVGPYARKIGINYPILLGETDGAEFGHRVGNMSGSLPFSAVIDRGGKVVTTRLGIFKEEQLEKILVPLLAQRT